MYNLKQHINTFWVICAYFLSILFSASLSAQKVVTKETIDKQFEETVNHSYSDKPQKAIPILNRLYAESKSIGYKPGITKIGYTLAIMYFNSSDYTKVINLNEDFLNTSNEIEDFEKTSHIHRLKGCAYSELGLSGKAHEEYRQALKYALKIQRENNKLYALSLVYSNLANQLMKSSAPKDSIFANVKKCISTAEKINDTDTSFISKKYSLIAYSYIIMADEYKKENKELAESYYLKSLNIHEKKPVPLVEKVLLLSQLGYFYYDQKDYNKAVKYAESGLSLERKASLPQLRRDIFEVLSKSYVELHETENSKKYLNLFTTLNDSISNINKKAVDVALNNTISKQEELLVNNFTKQMIIYTLLSLVVIIFIISFLMQKKKQMQIQKIENVLEKLKKKVESPENSLVIDKKEKNKEEKSMLMSQDAEEKLLAKLSNFEDKKLFLERKVSLSYLAVEIETNTKYLSFIIKKHKGKDFNEYINDLRIAYIIDKITNDPVYRQYKINALAEETGFSSHSKFATIFKGNTGVSPSEFIKYFDKK